MTRSCVWPENFETGETVCVCVCVCVCVYVCVIFDAYDEKNAETGEVVNCVCVVCMCEVIVSIATWSFFLMCMMRKKNVEW